MKTRPVHAETCALLLALVFVAGCATAPVPAPEAPRQAAGSMDHPTAPGPPKGFTITQELTSKAEVQWDGELPGKGRVKDVRRTGLRILADFEVIERVDNTAVIRATMRKTEIAQGDQFIPAPFLQLGPPEAITYKVNYRMRMVEFSMAEKAYQAWADRLKGTSAWEVMSAAFNVRSYVTQLKDLLGRAALDFAGNTYSFGRTISEKRPFFVPLLGAGISLGPVDIDLRSSLRYVEVSGGRKIFRIKGEQSSAFMRLDPPGLSARMHALGADIPPAFESEGRLKGFLEAQVDAGTGWTTELRGDFTSVITTGFAGGELTETVNGVRFVTTK